MLTRSGSCAPHLEWARERAQPVRGQLAPKNERSATTDALLALGGGLLYALAQPGWGWWPLAFVCALPIFASLRGRNAIERAWRGWLAGTAATCFSTVVPAAVSSSSYLGIPLWQALIIAMTVGQIFGAASFAFAAAVAGPLEERSGVATALRLGLTWTGAEFLRSTLFTGLPWILYGHALVEVPVLLQPAAWLGAPGLTALVVVTSGALFALAQKRDRGPLLLLLAIAGIFAGSWALTPLSDLSASSPLVARPGSVFAAGHGPAEALRVALVQGNLPDERGSRPEGFGRELAGLVDLSSDADLDLAIWPENALRVVMPDNVGLLERAWPDVATRPTHLLLGASRSSPTQPGRLSNAAHLLDHNLETLAKHDKVHLLPGFEYIPGILRTIGVEGHDTLAGVEPRLLPAGNLRIGALVCFEIAFEELAVALRQQGADLFVNISNDGWFGSTGAVEQHFASAVFRAVETGRPVLRATNTGITAAVDAWGRVVARAPVQQAARLDVDVVPGGPSTLYARSGNWFGPASLVAAILWLLVASRSEPESSTRRGKTS